MNKKQWHLLIWSALLLALLLHTNFCEWALSQNAEKQGLQPVLTLGHGGVAGLYSDREDLDFSRAFLYGVALPLSLVVLAVFVSMRRPGNRNRADDISLSSMKLLAETGRKVEEAAISVLIQGLRDGNEDVRTHSAKVLAELGPGARDAVPALVETLKDAAPRVRGRAARALGKMGKEAESALPALNDVLKDEDQTVRLFAVEAVKRIQGKQPR